MKRTDFEFFVTKHSKVETEKGITYKLELITGAGHKLIFKATSDDLFEGYPIGQAVTVKLTNPQTTLSELREEATSKEE